MEEEKKKKRNRRKKNKQNQRVDDVVVGGPVSSADDNHIGDVDIAQSSAGLCVHGLQPSHQINVVNNDQLEETIKKLHDENDSYLHREVLFKETIQRLEIDNETHIQQKAFLEERLVQLKTQIGAHIQNKVVLEERIVELKTENETYIQSKRKLEERIVNLENENDKLVHDMSSMKVKINQLQEERTTVSQKEVKELEESESNYLNHNQSMETTSNLHVQLENHETNIDSHKKFDVLAKDAFEEELNSQIAASCTLEKLLVHDEMKQEDYYTNIETPSVKRNLLEGEREKNVVVSLNSNGEVDEESQVIVPKEDNISVVPLVDAPLIGAPFRFVSFVARYVSGADLVEKATR